MPVVPKSFSYTQSRRSGKPPSDEGGGTAQTVTEGENQVEKKLSPSQPVRLTAPSSEGAVGAFATAFAVVGQNTQAKDNSMSL